MTRDPSDYLSPRPPSQRPQRRGSLLSCRPVASEILADFFSLILEVIRGPAAPLMVRFIGLELKAFGRRHHQGAHRPACPSSHWALLYASTSLAAFVRPFISDNSAGPRGCLNMSNISSEEGAFCLLFKALVHKRLVFLHYPCRAAAARSRSSSLTSPHGGTQRLQMRLNRRTLLSPPRPDSCLFCALLMKFQETRQWQQTLQSTPRGNIRRFKCASCFRRRF